MAVAEPVAVLDLRHLPPTPQRLPELVGRLLEAGYRTLLLRWGERWPAEHSTSRHAYPEQIPAYIDRVVSADGASLVHLFEAIVSSSAGFEHLQAAVQTCDAESTLLPSVCTHLSERVEDALSLQPHLAGIAFAHLPVLSGTALARVEAAIDDVGLQLYLPTEYAGDCAPRRFSCSKSAISVRCASEPWLRRTRVSAELQTARLCRAVATSASPDDQILERLSARIDAWRAGAWDAVAHAFSLVSARTRSADELGAAITSLRRALRHGRTEMEAISEFYAQCVEPVDIQEAIDAELLPLRELYLMLNERSRQILRSVRRVEH